MIDGELAAFLEGGQSIHVGTRDAEGRPDGARGVAARVDADGVHLEVYVSKVAFERIRARLDTSRQAAVVFGRPTDDRACQVKGTVVGVRSAERSERRFALAQWDGLLTALDRIGIPRALADRWAHWPAEVVRLRVTAVFEQTPGPQAGAQLS